MSAITGIFNRNGSFVSPDRIKTMNECLSHRGPDGHGIWAEGPVALGHQMLHTTHESLQEKLPFYDKSSGMVITADARIDNRSELSDLIDLENRIDIPDSLFILKAYQKWGSDCSKFLLGDFAFAIWDPQHDLLFCSRDHMGIKPFYYYLSENVFYFATEIKALLKMVKNPPIINEFMIGQYITYNLADDIFTFYENIFKLPNAHKMTIGFENSSSNCYWKLDPEKTIVYDSDEEYISKFLKIFTESVRCRIRSPYKIGAWLSGGLDSSSIACTAINLLKPKKTNLNTFSVTFKTVHDSDESYFINEVIDYTDVKPHFIEGDQISPLLGFEEIAWHTDQLVHGPNIFMSWSLYKKAGDLGIRVLLDGTDGDTVLSHGKGYLKDLTLELQLKKLLKEINGLSSRKKSRKDQIFFNQVFVPLIPQKIRNILSPIWTFLNYSGNVPRKFRSPIKKNFSEILEENLHYNCFEDRFKDIGYAKLNHYNNLVNPIHQFSLEVGDHLAAAFNIEHRFPFYDRRLIEFCLAIPTEMKFRDGWDRFILRSAMKNIIPPTVQWRLTKTALGENFKKSFFEFEKETIENVILQNHPLISKYFDMDELMNEYKEYKTEKYNINGNIALNLWTAITLELWLRSIDI